MKLKCAKCSTTDHKNPPTGSTFRGEPCPRPGCSGIMVRPKDKKR